MTFWRLLLAFLRARALPYCLTVLLMTLGVMVMLMLLGAESSLRQQFERDAGGVDLVVGARGSPLQLVLSSLYHADVPTGNIRIKDAEALCRHRDIKACVPLALGDNYQGFRIVGTDVALAAQHGLWGLHQTLPALKPLEALLGAEVAVRTGLDTGNRFVGSHGLAGDGHQHDALPYRVIGILPRTGTVADRLILTPVASVHQLHAEEGKQAAEEITALLMQVHTPRAVIGLPRWINANTPLMAAHPASEITRLYALLGGGLDSLRAVSMLVIAVSLLSLFIVLYASLRARLPDLAMLRVVGWPRQKIGALVLTEGLAVTALGLLTGSVLAIATLPAFAAFAGLPVTGVSGAVLVSSLSLGVAGAILVLAILACVLPVWRVYRLPVAATLARP